MATWCGVLGSVFCIAVMLTALVAQVTGHTVPGWASVFVAVLFLGAIQLLCLGLLGEYVGRLYAEAQGRPLYHVAADSAAAKRPRQSSPATELTPTSEDPDSGTAYDSAGRR
jgi:dolichol-phosphate mannosyltransferase